ncbi:hypothetical protein M0805_008064 [Coniferiporia weirii]|nr:hypothetical protein M0805_008064 [Coniferiporia weirii]
MAALLSKTDTIVNDAPDDKKHFAGLSLEKNVEKIDTMSERTARTIIASSIRTFMAAKWSKVLQPNAYRDHLRLVESLHLAVTNSGVPSSVLVGETSLALATDNAWLKQLFSDDTMDKLFASEHLGNYVLVRSTGQKVFEAMPIYARIGMHLLFYGSVQIRLLRWKAIRNILRAESIRQGTIYDSTDEDVVRAQIANFVKTYSIDLSELAQPDLTTYKTFNDFFSRKLRSNARPPASPNNPTVIVSAADCRLSVWRTWRLARKIWVKGRHFTLQELVGSRRLVQAMGPHPTLAICRLAPQDYHRFHSPVAGTLTSITHIPGEYYTVNPQAVNEQLDVLTANTRSVAVLHISKEGDAEKRDVPVLIVAVGALLVGSIGWDKEVGESVGKGEGLGYFRYGGSTVICVFPDGVAWDTDLVSSSEVGVEVLVKAGERVGQFQLIM